MLVNGSCSYIVSNQDKCCNEVTLSWKYQTMLKRGKPVSSPTGVFRMLSVTSNQKAVFYNKEAEFYLYNRLNEWVVSTIRS